MVCREGSELPDRPLLVHAGGRCCMMPAITHHTARPAQQSCLRQGETHPSPRPGLSLAPDIPEDAATIIWFLRFLHADRKGYFCINAGIADDQAVTGILMLLPNDDHPNITSTRKWFYYDPERPDLLLKAATYALELEAAYGNVYTARCLFRSKSAKQDYAYASPIIFLDDAPHDPPIPYTLYMDTGTGSGQAYLRTVKPPTKADSIRVKQALNCDPTGSADNKLLRLPCTHNTKTKHGGNYPVQIDTFTDATYSIEQLHAVFPPVADAPGPERERAAIPWDAAKEQRLTTVYRQVDRMLTPAGIPKVIAADKDPNNDGRRIFENRTFIASFRHASGTWDASRVRWWRVKALIVRGVTDEQAAALIYACEHADTRTQKGSIAIWNDIKVCVDHWRAAYPQIAVSDYSQKLQDAMLKIFDNTAPPPTPQPRTRKGRPCSTLSPTDVMTHYQAEAAQNTLWLNRRSRAGLLGISTATLDRLEQILRDRGDIAIHTTPDRRGSWVEILVPEIAGGVIKNTGLGVIKNVDLPTNPESAIQGNTMPEMKVLADVCIKGETHPLFRPPGAVPVAASAPERNGEECVPSQSTPEPLPPLADSPPARPVESLRFTGVLIERVADALILVAETPPRQQTPLVQAILAVQNITLTDKRLKLVMGDARYLLRVRELPDGPLKREYGKNRAMVIKEQKRLGLANFKAMQEQCEERAGEGKLWVLYYRYRAVLLAYGERWPAPPDLDEQAGSPRASDTELVAIKKHQRGTVNPEKALQRALWRREVDAGRMDGSEADARETLDTLGLGVIVPKPPVTPASEPAPLASSAALIDPEQAVQRAIWQREGMDQSEIAGRETLEALDIGTIKPIQNSQSTPYDALGLPDRLRNLVGQAVPGHIAATQRMGNVCIVALPYH